MHMRYFSLPLLRCVLLPISLLALSAGVVAIDLASGLPQ